MKVEAQVCRMACSMIVGSCGHWAVTLDSIKC